MLIYRSKKSRTHLFVLAYVLLHTFKNIISISTGFLKMISMTFHIQNKQTNKQHNRHKHTPFGNISKLIILGTGDK